MEHQLKKKYGLSTAICMVVGIVIGSGIFFKAEAVLNKTAGNVPMGVLAWLLVGAIMVVCAYSFSTMALTYPGSAGLVDYAHETVGKRYAYLVGWFFATIYTPCLVAAVAAVAGRYTCMIVGLDPNGGGCMAIASTYLIFFYALNVLAPVIAGQMQVSVTIVKMIPLILMAVVGTTMGVKTGMLQENIAAATGPIWGGGAESGSLMGAAVSVAFAYEGWVLTTSISEELDNPRRNMPIALIGGSLIIVATYVFYYIGLCGAVSTEELMNNGQAAVQLAFRNTMGSFAGTLVFLMVVVSCLGGLNGLTLSGCRGFYALACRGEGPAVEMLKQVNPVTNLPTNASVLSLLVNMLWLLYYYGAVIDGGWFGAFNFDASELPVITLYAMYIPLFLGFMVKGKGLTKGKRYVGPILSLAGCVFMVYAAFIGHGVGAVTRYLIVFAVIMLVGNYFYKNEPELSPDAA